MAHPQRTPETAAWQGWYCLTRWRRLRHHQLSSHPLCKMCLEENPPRVVEATVVDHVVNHKGDPHLFWYGELQSLCKRHHDGAKQQIDRTGFSTAIGADGWPDDPNHPANRPSHQ